MQALCNAFRKSEWTMQKTIQRAKEDHHDNMCFAFEEYMDQLEQQYPWYEFTPLRKEFLLQVKQVLYNRKAHGQHQAILRLQQKADVDWFALPYFQQRFNGAKLSLSSLLLEYDQYRAYGEKVTYYCACLLRVNEEYIKDEDRTDKTDRTDGKRKRETEHEWDDDE